MNTTQNNIVGAAPAAVAPQGERQWICPTRTVADLVNNLLTLDQALPAYGAQYIEKDGRRCAIAVPPTVSRERVKDSRWIGQGEELNAAVIWTRAEQPAAVAGPADERVPDDVLAAIRHAGLQLIRTGEGFRVEKARQFTAAAAPALEAPAAPARIVADALIRLDAIYREEADCDEPPQRPDWLVNALHLAAAAPQAPAAPWKDHKTARLVNDLRDCAIKYHGAGQLRERIAHIVVPLCDQLKGALAAPAAPAVDATSDTALLDAMQRHRIALVPEFEGPWDAEIFNDEAEAPLIASGNTPREALHAVLAAQAAAKGSTND